MSHRNTTHSLLALPTPPIMLHYKCTTIDWISPELFDSICSVQWNKEQIQINELNSRQRVWFDLFPFWCTISALISISHKRNGKKHLDELLLKQLTFVFMCFFSTFFFNVISLMFLTLIYSSVLLHELYSYGFASHKLNRIDFTMKKNECFVCSMFSKVNNKLKKHVQLSFAECFVWNSRFTVNVFILTFQ